MILATGALVGLSRRSNRVLALLDDAQRSGSDVLVPAGALTESLRGGRRDALIDRLLKGPRTEVAAHDVASARSAGKLLGRTRTSGAIDALVVAVAIRRRPSMIATSDPDDITLLADGYDDVTVVQV